MSFVWDVRGTLIARNVGWRGMWERNIGQRDSLVEVEERPLGLDFLSPYAYCELGLHCVRQQAENWSRFIDSDVR